MMPKKLRGIRMTQAALDFLCQRYPKCFALANPQPLKIGIQRDVLQDLPAEVSRNAIENAFGTYTKRLEYLKGVVTGRARIDLEGVASGIVTPEEQTYAVARIELAQPPPGTKQPVGPPPQPTTKKPVLKLPKAKSVS
jgi:sRNA-binding protein